MTKLISAFPEWANYRLIAVAEDGTVYQIRLTEDGLAGEWSKIADSIMAQYTLATDMVASINKSQI